MFGPPEAQLCKHLRTFWQAALQHVWHRKRGFLISYFDWVWVPMYRSEIWTLQRKERSGGSSRPVQSAAHLGASALDFTMLQGFTVLIGNPRCCTRHGSNLWYHKDWEFPPISDSSPQHGLQRLARSLMRTQVGGVRCSPAHPLTERAFCVLWNWWDFGINSTLT